MSNSKFRSWMDSPRIDEATGEVTEEYAAGLKSFMDFAAFQSLPLETGKMYCPCIKCQNMNYIPVKNVCTHIYRRGFFPSYKIWYFHGENTSNIGSYSGVGNVDVDEDLGNMVDEEVDVNVGSIGVGGIGVEAEVSMDNNNGTFQMINDAFRENVPVFTEASNRGEEPNVEALNFFNMLDAAKKPLYFGCSDDVSPLSTAAEMMNIKTDYNLPESCMDRITGLIRKILPKDNTSPTSYNDIQKLVTGLGLPYQMIDVCEDNCMIFWGEDSNAICCRFCHKPRFQDTGGRTRVPYKRMWYLPLAERLKRLYQSERTAGPMRWHAEHNSAGEITHPSDAKAWKHFQSVYPDFARETRNVYLGLSTDGFNPFGKHGRPYSVWPVIVTPYNLPPELCMKPEFLFLTVLIPGPDHPRRSIDVFLQPLIYELNQLWDSGTTVYDVSTAQNFLMKVVLMWTISDFPAYGMLSGWSTHGKLACPHCQDNTEAFQLKYGRKTSWFDCHRRFLPFDHPYRHSTSLFTKNKKVLYGLPAEHTGAQILTQLRDFDAESTARCGGNGHYSVDGVGVYHNWHKKSIFWELPYWKNHLLRHCLDVMHIEKNVFDNSINTVLNVQGKSKDNLKSRLDLPDICDRQSLHIRGNNNIGPVPIFRLSKEKKDAFFYWIKHKVKFPDGYASNLRNCVDSKEGKFCNMKSHDCHVVMQRLFPFAFAYLLPRNVHEALAGIGAFFRDLCSRTLTLDEIKNLNDKIPVILCNLEKIFPPSFFDVMEHLPVHLPREAELGGPVQYRWMYPFERYMFKLKKKVKNLSRVEGSIVAQCINEETANFASLYFPVNVQTKSRRPPRNDDGGDRPIYPAYVPDIFSQIGRVSGKSDGRTFSPSEIKHLHMYIATNCPDLMELESLYMGQIRVAYPHYSEDQLQNTKENEFTDWLNYYVTETSKMGKTFPTWLEDFVSGPLLVAKSFPMYFTRGYSFKILREKMIRPTSDFGISTTSSDMIYYGVLREILEVHYPGLLDLKCIVFYCEWYNPILGVGVRVDEFGVTSVNSRRKLGKYDPFILASQADQVTYLSYPRVSTRSNGWITVTSTTPRGRLHGDSEYDAMQQPSPGILDPLRISLEVDHCVDMTSQAFGTVHDDSDNELPEFGQEYDDGYDSEPDQYANDSQ